MRKSLTGITAQDILLKWMYEDHNGNDVYAVHMAANYRVNGIPIGTATYFPETRDFTLHLQKGVSKRLQAVGPTQ